MENIFYIGKVSNRRIKSFENQCDYFKIFLESIVLLYLKKKYEGY